MTTLYEPKEAVVLAATSDLFRIGIQGAPKTGKTWAALSFPNPVVLDFDNNLRGFSEVYPNKKILSIPFWDAKFCDSVGAVRTSLQAPANQRDAFRIWINNNISKFTPEQTVILDSWTRLQDGFDRQQELEPQLARDGTVNEFAFWALKQEFSRDVLGWLINAPCNVIVIFHETGERDKKGIMTGKLKPMMEGRFADKLAGYFTDWYRQQVFEEEIKNTKGEVVDRKRHFVWQVKPDNMANCGTSLRTLDIKADTKNGFVPATYNSLIA